MIIHKKWLCLLLICMFSVFLCPDGASAAAAEPKNTSEFAGGTGTLDNPYKVSTPEHLNNVRYHLDAYFIQTQDIDMTAATAEGGAYDNAGLGWQSIGKGGMAFTGNYNGGGNQIVGLKSMNGTLFDYNEGTIENLGMVNDCVVKGGIARYNAGLIQYCYHTGVTNAVTAYFRAWCAGGITGENDGQIVGCFNAGTVAATNDYDQVAVGGIAGDNYGTIQDCYNMGNVAVSLFDECYAGGIVGDNDLGTISNCYNIGRVTAPLYTASAGGIAGWFDDMYGCMENCYTIQDETYCVQGTALTADQMKQQESFEGFDFSKVWELDAASPYPFPVLRAVRHIERAEDTVHFAGGNGTRFHPYLVSTAQHLDHVREHLGEAFVQTADIDLTAATAKNGEYYHDGAGWIPIGSEKEHLFTGWYDGGGFRVIGLKSQTGGIFGYSSGIIHNLGSVDGVITCSPKTYTDTYVGGIAGYNWGMIQNCYHTGKIGDMTFSHTYSGGIAGYHEGIITGCYNTGDITGGYVGGIVGDGHLSQTTENCYNTGTIMAGPNYQYVYAGGIMGRSGSISRCYNTGDVTANGLDGAYAGGIAGDGGAMRDCYNTGDVTAVSQYYTAYAGGLFGDTGSALFGYNIGNVTANGGDRSYAGMIAGDASISSLRYVYYVGRETDLGVGNQEADVSLHMRRTMEQMWEENSLIGLDFQLIWAIDENFNDGLPILRGVGNALSGVALQEPIVKFADGIWYDSRWQTYHSTALLINQTNRDISTTVFVAFYDAAGRLTALSVYQETDLPAGGTVDLQVEVNTTQTLGSVKLFCLDHETLIPFGRALYI